MTTTYTISQFKAHASRILRELEAGEEVIITRRGEPCGKVTGVSQPVADKRSRRSLMGILATPDTPDLEFDELQAIIKGFWKNFGELPEEDGAEWVGQVDDGNLDAGCRGVARY